MTRITKQELFLLLPRTGKHVFQTMVKYISADQDELQRCFFADQKQFPADR
jgi:hypothetical protein